MLHKVNMSSVPLSTLSTWLKPFFVDTAYELLLSTVQTDARHLILLNLSQMLVVIQHSMSTC